MSAPEEKRIAFLRRKFAEYYRSNLDQVVPPAEMEKREFGFLVFKEKLMIRHKGFRTKKELHDFILATIPSDAYHSTAYYENPIIEMGRKGWLGADLVFDLDADHIKTPCKDVHDKWMCRDCKLLGRGTPPDRCPQCKNERFEEDNWLCELCLEKAKDEMLKLIDFLTNDFGVDRQSLHVFFSGHRGYHLHVRDETVKNLSDNERKEIVDYLLGLGILPSQHGLYQKGTILRGPEFKEPGWRGRLAQGTYETLTKMSFEELTQLGFRRGEVEAIQKWSDEAPSEVLEKSLWGAMARLGEKNWMKIVERTVKDSSVQIDTVVTTDTHRLIRQHGSLHGKTGLKVVVVPLNDLESFDPFTTTVAMKGEDTVHIKEAPKFRLGQESFGPYRDEEATIPSAAAVLLVCKRRAETVGD